MTGHPQYAVDAFALHASGYMLKPVKKERLEAEGIRTEADLRNEKIGFKIREARNRKIPYILVLGDQEVENGTAALRTREGDQGAKPLDEIISFIKAEIREKKN